MAATDSRSTPVSIPSLSAKICTSSNAGAAGPPEKLRMTVSTMSTPLIMAISTEARPKPGVQWVCRLMGMPTFFLRARISSPDVFGSMSPAMSLMVIMSAPRPASCSALVTK